MTTDELTTTAYHECGHALIAILLGGRVDLLTIEPDVDETVANRMGETRVLWTDAFSEKDVALKEIRIALAGPVAEMVLEGDTWEPDFLSAWRTDWEMATERAKDWLPRNQPLEEYLGRCVHELIQFLEREDVWAALAALADQLEAHETLEAEQIEEVLEAWPIEA